MAINSVSSSTSALPQTRPAPAAKVAPQPAKAEAAKVREADQRPSRQPEPVKPVVNDRGETTGAVINTSA